ncbi:uncharacterized protein BDZ99DRAFT_466382 [Mytilinidion resinicola]|uniref:Uncharacterized protein n=1 Tax=Mytilinidion resinicola TaxID=574789 RepID=A0A6A6YB94_9PEZI|nr:uncharacterized protein BDZ99DRAFT_466382 [Mytilinidion resinicola]KAF2806106.1 hypothetical protein BDZ99DRAFT_466382 [Mytilinidion resinicola]
MRFFVLALFLNLCCVLGSPAVRRADTATPTSTLQSSSTTPSAAATSQSFLWSNGQNTSYGGYYPEWDVCPGVGTTCEQACGLGAVKCGSYSDTCYFPRLGDTCCSDTGVSCWAGTTCAYIEVDYDTNYFCCSEVS